MKFNISVNTEDFYCFFEFDHSSNLIKTAKGKGVRRGAHSTQHLIPAGDSV